MTEILDQTAAQKTYGQLGWGKTRFYGRPVWGIKAEPHVHMRIKRILPRVDVDSTGVIYVQDTPEVARDIEWLVERFPLRMTPEVAERLRERAAEHRRTQDAVTRILDGYSPPTGWREPARPARPYQQQAADIVHAKGWLLLGDDVGLGKSTSGLLVLRNPEALPAVVVCPTHLPHQWLGELKKVLPWLTGHVVKTGKHYDVAARCGGRMPDVLILSYSKLAKWAPFLAGWAKTVIYDEIQDLRHGEMTEKGRGAKMLSRACRFRMGLSATPIHGYGHEIHTVIDMLEEDALGTRDEFVREWGGAQHGRAGDQYEVADPRSLGTYLRDQGMMLLRTRKDVGREIPEPIRITQPVEADTAKIDAVVSDVMDMARLLLDANSDNHERFVAAGEIDWRLRQATGIAKAPFVAEFVKLLLEREEKIVLWGWHRDVYDIWLHRLRRFRPVLYTGSESPTAKQRNAQEFTEGDARVLIMSLRSGSGLNGLQNVASVGVFGELDWSPAVHEQCIGRLWRDGQEAAVTAFYMLSEDGSDPFIADVLGIKDGQWAAMKDPDARLAQVVGNPGERAKQLAAWAIARREHEEKATAGQTSLV